jgi:hypothetical protein
VLTSSGANAPATADGDQWRGQSPETEQLGTGVAGGWLRHQISALEKPFSMLRSQWAIALEQQCAAGKVQPITRAGAE